jgi:sugar lactone lactonase YvrE
MSAGETVMTDDQIRAALSIQWSPDGKAIIYTDSPRVRNVWSQPISGGPPQKLTDFKEEGVFNCALSLYGKQLACRRLKTTSDAIMISNFR